MNHLSEYSLKQLRLAQHCVDDPLVYAEILREIAERERLKPIERKQTDALRDL